MFALCSVEVHSTQCRCGFFAWQLLFRVLISSDIQHRLQAILYRSPVTKQLLMLGCRERFASIGFFILTVTKMYDRN